MICVVEHENIWVCWRVDGNVWKINFLGKIHDWIWGQNEDWNVQVGIAIDDIDAYIVSSIYRWFFKRWFCSKFQLQDKRLVKVEECLCFIANYWQLEIFCVIKFDGKVIRFLKLNNIIRFKPNAFKFKFIKWWPNNWSSEWTVGSNSKKSMQLIMDTFFKIKFWKF